MANLGTPLVGGISNALSGLTPGGTKSSSGSNFANILNGAISQVENTNAASNGATLDLLTGNTDDLSSVMITTEKAELAVNLTVAIRNKAVDAYKEIMNMQV